MKEASFANETLHWWIDIVPELIARNQQQYADGVR